MLVIPGHTGKDLCDDNAALTRRDVLRVGGTGHAGPDARLPAAIAGQGRPRRPAAAGPGWGKAKSIILVYLQGGPSHLDLWDPKENVPDNVRSAFKPIATKIPGVKFTEILPRARRRSTTRSR